MSRQVYPRIFYRMRKQPLICACRIKFFLTAWTAVACVFGSALANGADSLRIGGTGTALGTMRQLAQAYMERHPDSQVSVVPSLGSSGGIKAVLGGAIDLAVTSRPITAAEMHRGAREQEYARTPFVFAVANASSLRKISISELADMYAGRAVTWPDGKRVRVILRPISDADTELVMAISPALRESLLIAQNRPGIRYSITDQDAADDLERIPGAIGPTTLALILSERRALHALILEGKEPTLANAVSGHYPYFKRLFLVTGATQSRVVASFTDFVTSERGRRILGDSGHWVP